MSSSDATVPASPAPSQRVGGLVEIPALLRELGARLCVFTAKAYEQLGTTTSTGPTASTVITDANGVVISQPAEGMMMAGDPYAGIGYRDDWRTHDWNCDCKSCRFRGRMQAHSMAMENCYCKMCNKDPHHRHMYYHDCSGRDMLGYFHSKFGYFCPSGAGGAGAPFFGKYARVYPQDVNYFDGRDGQLYAAQGYGAPMAVPLAPVVGHTYNYGWGIPSSRLTPISHHAYR